MPFPNTRPVSWPTFPPAMPRAVSLWLRIAGLAALSIGAPAPAAFAQTPPVPSAEAQIYERYRAWVTRQPPGGSPKELLDRYRQVLAGEGMAPADVDRHLRVIAEQGRDLEIERWNRILTSEKPNFNVLPNQFLVDRTKGLKPGRALDVGMGQGRNALFLAQQGWEVTGFDPAGKAVAAAEAQAKALGVKLTTQVARDDQFEFGADRWDLIVLSYVSLRHLLPQVRQALAPGGFVIVEAFHRDATKAASIGGGVVFDSNELLRLFDGFRIVHYEDADATGDFGKQMTRVVRLFAQKQ